MEENIQKVQIGVNRYAPPEASAINLFTFNGQEKMTLAQLVMAVCIQRAATDEKAAVTMSNKLAQSTGYLKALSKCVSVLMEGDDDYWLDSRALDLTDTTYTPQNVGLKTNLADFICKELGIELGTAIRYVDSLDPTFHNLTPKIKEELIRTLKETDSYRYTMEKEGRYDPIDILEINGYTDLWGDPIISSAYTFVFAPLLGGVPSKLENITVGNFLTSSLSYLNKDLTTPLPLKFSVSGTSRIIGTNGRTELFNKMKRMIEDATNLSQEQIIDLQSCVNRRDVCYNMSSDIAGAMLVSLGSIANKFH